MAGEVGKVESNPEYTTLTPLLPRLHYRFQFNLTLSIEVSFDQILTRNVPSVAFGSIRTDIFLIDDRKVIRTDIRALLIDGESVFYLFFRLHIHLHLFLDYFLDDFHFFFYNHHYFRCFYFCEFLLNLGELVAALQGQV